ncbi:MAG: hypothetical protein COA86_02650 [Kangiella sp.]|nr:MAG: hypothetical protein COA86_02650 [Kangiella sp.]
MDECNCDHVLDLKSRIKKLELSCEKSVVSNEKINELFDGTNFGEPTNSSVEMKRKQITKTLKDQIAGYWSGHTAYHIAVDGGFLVDAKSDADKKLTPLGLAFLNENN